MSSNSTRPTILPVHQTFPADFVWGFAAAAPQIEGAAWEDGKGASIWDTFARQPGAVHNGDTLDVACDHYHRYAEDFDLMRDLGAKAYRLSIAWPRIYPEGAGRLNQPGLDFYNRLIDSMLERGLTPWVTMFHWDLPQALEEAHGGWRGRATVDAFATYADMIVKSLGDRVKNWITLNEILCFTLLGYGAGQKAPGLKLPARIVNQTYHHALLCHGHGVRAVREHGGAGARVGLTDNCITPIPVTETPADEAAARSRFVDDNIRVLDPIYRGEYSDRYFELLGPDAATVEDGDFALIARPTDFLGLNIYTGYFVREGADGQPESLPYPPSYPEADAFWLKIAPQALYWGPRHVAEVYRVPSIYITENGAGYNDLPPGPQGVVDLHRREIVRNCLRETLRAMGDGVPVHGYFLWSFMDNYEWEDGYQRRFGTVYCDFETQKRTPKLSAHWYSRTMRENRIV